MEDDVVSSRAKEAGQLLAPEILNLSFAGLACILVVSAFAASARYYCVTLLGERVANDLRSRGSSRRTIALVGPSGAGKSTVFHLLLRRPARYPNSMPKVCSRS